MKFSVFAIALSLLGLFYCLGFVLIPAQFMSQFGIQLDPAGVALGKMFGAALGAQAIILWLVRGKSPNDISAKAVLWSTIFLNAVCMIVIVNSILDKVANSLAWGNVCLEILIILGCIYLLILKPKTAESPRVQG